jgi:hypothetical protein
VNLSDKQKAKHGTGSSVLLGRCPQCRKATLLCSNRDMLSRPSMTTVLCAMCGWNTAIPSVMESPRSVRRLPTHAPLSLDGAYAEPIAPASVEVVLRLVVEGKHSRPRKSGRMQRTAAQASRQPSSSGFSYKRAKRPNILIQRRHGGACRYLIWPREWRSGGWLSSARAFKIRFRDISLSCSDRAPCSREGCQPVAGG